MRVLLDSNVWRYLVDHGDLHALKAAATAAGVEIVVVPGLVFEARLLRDDATRKKILAWLAHAGGRG
jgi:putative intracellular protease/amidase